MAEPPGGTTDQAQTVSLQLMVNISETLAGLVQGMLGPCGQQTLLSSQTGQVLVTRDGWAVLSSLHLAHPLARLLTDSLRACHSAYGDGSKIFTLYLAQALREVKNLIALEGSPQHAQIYQRKLSTELLDFMRDDFQHVKSLFWDRVQSSAAESGRLDFTHKAQDIVRTSLAICLQKHLVSFFTDCVSAFLSLKSQTPSNCGRLLSHVVQHFDMYRTKVFTQPQQKSRICQGVLLEADLQALFPPPGTGGALSRMKKFIVTDIDFGESDQQIGGKAVILKASPEKVSDLFFSRRLALKKNLTSLKTVTGVDVLLCAEGVPQYVSSICQEVGVTVRVLNLEKLVFLRELFRVTMLKDVSQDDLSDCVFSAKVNAFIQIRNRMCSLIQVQENSGSFDPMNHMVICAPTEGMCEQVCHSVYKALKTLHLCLQQGKEVTNTCRSRKSSTESSCTSQPQTPRCDPLLTIHCGGTFEASLSIALTDHSATTSRPNRRVSTLIQKMLVAVPRALHANLTSSKHGTERQFTQKWTCMLSQVRAGCAIGLNDHGDVCDGVVCGHAEPAVSRLDTVDRVLQLVVQMLRVESLVSVKKLPICDPSSVLGRHAEDSDDDDGG